jgi:hypothetical protein
MKHWPAQWGLRASLSLRSQHFINTSPFTTPFQGVGKGLGKKRFRKLFAPIGHAFVESCALNIGKKGYRKEPKKKKERKPVKENSQKETP